MELKKLKAFWFSVVALIFIVSVIAGTYTPTITTTAEEDNIISANNIDVDAVAQSATISQIKKVDNMERNNICEKVEDLWAGMSQVEKTTMKKYIYIQEFGTQQERLAVKNVIDNNYNP